LDPLLIHLRNEAIGCHVGKTYCASSGYADYVILWSPTRQGLTRKLQLCAEYAAAFKVSFNPTKSKVIHVPRQKEPRAAPQGEAQFQFMGGRINYVQKDLHLGCLVGNVTADEVIDFN
jgi:hypothetical protein